MGIEPTLFAWEAKVLPLNYTRMAEHVIAFWPSLAHIVSSMIRIRRFGHDSEDNYFLGEGIDLPAYVCIALFL